MKKEFVKKLHAFAWAYLLQRKAMRKDADDDEVTAAVLGYMAAARELTDDIKDTYKEEEPKLPSLEVFFLNGLYHDYARRIYAGILGSGTCRSDEAWRLVSMVEVGNVLKESWNENQFIKEDLNE